MVSKSIGVYLSRICWALWHLLSSSPLVLRLRCLVVDMRRYVVDLTST